MNRQKAVIDAHNAAYLQAPRDPRPNIRNIRRVIEAVEASGRDALFVMDPGIRSLIVDVDELKKLLSDPRLIPLDGGKDIGQLVVETAAQFDAVIVSNNTYAEYAPDYPWIEERRIAVAAVNDQVVLLDRKMKLAS